MKQIISLIVLASVLLCSVAFAEAGYVCDINDDTLMNNKDAVMVAQHIDAGVLLGAAKQIIADVTLDGKVDLDDVQAIVNAFAAIQSLPLKIERTVGGVIYAVTHGDTAVTGSEGGLTQAVVSYDLHAVTAIGESAFEHQTDLTSITLPDTVKVIGKRAFAGCTALNEMGVSE